MYPLEKLSSPSGMMSSGLNESMFSTISAQNEGHIPDQMSSPGGPVLSPIGNKKTKISNTIYENCINSRVKQLK